MKPTIDDINHPGRSNAEPGKAPDKMSADKLHLFATQYAFIDGRLHEAEQAMLKFMLEFPGTIWPRITRPYRKEGGTR